MTYCGFFLPMCWCKVDELRHLQVMPLPTSACKYNMCWERTSFSFPHQVVHCGIVVARLWGKDTRDFALERIGHAERPCHTKLVLAMFSLRSSELLSRFKVVDVLACLFRMFVAHPGSLYYVHSVRTQFEPILKNAGRTSLVWRRY